MSTAVPITHGTTGGTAVLVLGARGTKRTAGPGCGNMIHYYRTLFNTPVRISVLL